MAYTILTLENAGPTINPPNALAPSVYNLNKIVINDHVKIRVQVNGKTEAFWCRVENIAGNQLTVVVDQDMVFTNLHGIKDTDVLTITIKNVLSIIKA